MIHVHSPVNKQEGIHTRGKRSFIFPLKSRRQKNYKREYDTRISSDEKQKIAATIGDHGPASQGTARHKIRILALKKKIRPQ